MGSDRDDREAEPDDRAAIAPATHDATVHVRRMVMAMRPGHDLGAIFARARSLDPAAVPASAVAEAERLMAARPLSRREEASGPHDAAALAPFAEALRGEIVAGTTTRLATPGRLRRRRLSALGVVAAVAAALLLLYAVGPEFAELRQLTSGGVEANLDGEVAHGSGAAPLLVPPAPRPEAGRKVMRSIAADESEEDVPEDSSEPVSEDVPEDSSEPPPEDVPEDRVEIPVPEDSVAPPEAVREDRSDVAPALRARKPKSRPATTLEQEAQSLWQAGDLAAAEKKYREIVREAGRSERAEFAYGDLFALARQRRGSAGQVAVWHEYLAVFPDGQFADDAHAGLCQRGPEEQAAACWAEYLERYPRGGHRRQAEAARDGQP